MLGILEMCRRTKRKKYEEEQAAGYAVEIGGKKHIPKKRRGIVDVVSAAVLTASKLKGETEF